MAVPGDIAVKSGVEGATRSSRALPTVTAILFFLVIATSSYVVVEPAPCDVLFLPLLLAVFANRNIHVPIDLHPALGVGLGLFVLANFTSLFGSVDISRASFFLAITLYLVLFWYTMVTLVANYGESALQCTHFAFLCAAAFATVLSLLIYFLPNLQDMLALRPTLGPRAHAAFKDPNVFAPFLCAAFLLVLNRMITHRTTLFSIGLLGLFAVGILSSFSRGGYVNLFVSLITLIVLHLVFLNRRRWLVRGFGIALVASVVAVPFVLVYLKSMGLESFFSQRLDLQSYDSGRFSVHYLALQTFGEDPFGIGPGQSELELPISTHNLYLRVAAENGLLGILGLLLFLATVVRTCLQGVAQPPHGRPSSVESNRHGLVGRPRQRSTAAGAARRGGAPLVHHGG